VCSHPTSSVAAGSSSGPLDEGPMPLRERAASRLWILAGGGGSAVDEHTRKHAGVDGLRSDGRHSLSRMGTLYLDGGPLRSTLVEAMGESDGSIAERGRDSPSWCETAP